MNLARDGVEGVKIFRQGDRSGAAVITDLNRLNLSGADFIRILRHLTGVENGKG